MGCVGGRVVCVCELINLRCVFDGMCIRGDGAGGRGRLCGVWGSDMEMRGKKKQE